MQRGDRGARSTNARALTDLNADATAFTSIPSGTPSSSTLSVSLRSVQVRGRTQSPIPIATTASTHVQFVSYMTAAAPMTPTELNMSLQTSR